VADHDIYSTPHQYELVQTKSEIESLKAKLQKATVISFDTETTGIDANQAELVGMSFCINEKVAYYIPIPADQNQAKEIVNQFKSILEDATKKLIGQNIK